MIGRNPSDMDDLSRQPKGQAIGSCRGHENAGKKGMIDQFYEWLE